MVHANGSMTVRCALDKALALLVDPTRIPEWRADVTSATALNEGAKPGARYSEVLRFMGEKSQTFEVVELVEDPAHARFTVRAIDGLPLRPTQSYQLERDGDATRITYDVELPVTGAFILMQPLLALMIPKKWAEYAEALRTLLER